jgi:hypothetical protein
MNELKTYKFTRIFALFALAVLLLLIYSNYTGCRIFRQNQGKSWNAGGPGGHK